MKLMHLPILLLGFACASPLVAHAQWQWIDSAGKKVFSDQAPPLDVPEKNILRRATATTPKVSFAPADHPPEANAPGAAPAPPKATGVDKDLEEKTKKAEEAEKARQAAEAQKIAQAKAENCTRARQGKATYDSGVRIARVNAQGEREFLDDKARAEEQQRLQTVINSDCK